MPTTINRFTLGIAGLLLLSGCTIPAAAGAARTTSTTAGPASSSSAGRATAAASSPSSTAAAVSAAPATSAGPATAAAAAKPAAKPASPAASAKLTPAAPAPVNCAVAKCVALTYDDGPSNNTYDLLDKLEAAKAPATFFYIGNQIDRYSDAVKRAVKDGIVIGNHTWTHPVMTGLSEASQQTQVDRTSREIQLAGAPKPTLMRPPYGDFDSATKNLGYPLIIWDVDTRDWSTHSGTSSLETIQNNVQPGSIILMHDFETSSVAETPTIVKWLRSKGYTLVTVPQLLGTTSAGHVYESRAAG